MQALSFTDYLLAIISFLIAFIIYTLKVSVPEYLKEKAKRLAQKEDIEEVTDKIKSIESKFNKDLELLKSQLTLSTQLQANFHNEERLSIIEFYESTFQYYKLLTSGYISSNDDYDSEDVSKAKNYLDQLNRELDLKYHKMALFLEGEDNEGIVFKSAKILDLILETLAKHHKTYYFEVIQSNLKMEHPTITHEERLKLIEERPMIWLDYYENIKPGVTSVYSELSDLRKRIKKYLHEVKRPTLT